MDAAVAHDARAEFHAAIVTIKPHLAEQDAWTVREVAAAILLFNRSGWFGGGAHGVILSAKAKQRKACREREIAANRGVADHALESSVGALSVVATDSSAFTVSRDFGSPIGRASLVHSPG